MTRPIRIEKRANTMVAMEKAKERKERIARLLWPSAPNEYGTTCLAYSDLSSHLINELKVYDALGEQHVFWRATTDLASIAQGQANDVANSFSFALSSFPGYTSMTASFDRYRLRGVCMQFSPMVTSTMAAVSSVFLPRLWTAIDYDDDNTVTRAEIQQYDTLMVSPPGCGIVRAIVPCLALAAYSGTFTSYANEELEWLDAASPSVRHYGIKTLIEGGSTTQSILQTYTVTVTGFFEFKSLR